MGSVKFDYGKLLGAVKVFNTVAGIPGHRSKYRVPSMLYR